MLKFALGKLLAAAVLLNFSVPLGYARPADADHAKPEIELLELGPGMTLRTFTVRPPAPKGTVLFLHGFPETVYAWKGMAQHLATDFEVRAFDWPGYGKSSRPHPDRFSYSPREYAGVLKQYIQKTGIDKSTLLIYGTDIGALPVLLLALEEPDIARTIIVGDFAPFDRPQYMYPSLQSLKSRPASDRTRAVMNDSRDEILENAFRRGLRPERQFQIPEYFRDDMNEGWQGNGITSADAFYHYYSHFTRDQNHLEANLDKLRTSVQVIWGELDIYIHKDMGLEFATRSRSALTVLPEVGHYPHLQVPDLTIQEIRRAFAGGTR